MVPSFGSLNKEKFSRNGAYDAIAAVRTCPPWQKENAALAVSLARLFIVRAAAALPLCAAAAAAGAAWRRAAAAAWEAAPPPAAVAIQAWAPCDGGSGGGELAAAALADRGAEPAAADAGPLPHAPAGVLDKAELDGLASTRWPGRAQASEGRV